MARSELFLDQIRDTERTVVVAKTGGEFSTIQEGIDHAYTTWSGTLSTDNPVVVLVHPGTYTEQIHSYRYIFICSLATGWDGRSADPPAVLYNTGADAAHYPLRANDGDFYQMVGMTIKTDDGNVFGMIKDGWFHNSVFREGHFIDNEEDDWTYVDFSRCAFLNSAYGGFYLTGSITNTTQIFLRKCHVTGTPTFTSTHTGSGLFATVDTAFNGHTEVAGDWSVRSTDCRYYGEVARNTYDTSGYVRYSGGSCQNGIHFISAPSEFKIIDTSFEYIYTNRIPDGEADVTADVPITDVFASNNTMHNGFAGEIEIIAAVKTVGNDVDSYRTIQAAIDAASAGDSVHIYPGIYVENITTKLGVSIQGIGFVGSVIIYGTSGDMFTMAPGEVGHGAGLVNSVNDLTIKFDPVGITNGRLVVSTAGTSVFKGCFFDVDITDGYMDLFDHSGEQLVITDGYIMYNQTGTGGGNHRMFKTTSSGYVSIYDTECFIDVASTDSSDHILFIDDSRTTDVQQLFHNSLCEVNASTPGYDGEVTFYRTTGGSTGRNIAATSDIYLHTPSGTVDSVGRAFAMDGDGAGSEIYSSSNSIRIEGFGTNYTGEIKDPTDLLSSHFDNITAVDGVTGSGTYSFVNSPSPGNLQMSGYIVNPYDNLIQVGKAGAEFTSIKTAVESITDASAWNRYLVSVGPGNYVELPFAMKAYVDVMSLGGIYNTNIIAAIPSSDLITAVGANELSGFTMQGTTASGKALVNYGAPFTAFVMSNCVVYNCSVGVKVTAGSLITRGLATIPVPFTSVGKLLEVTNGGSGLVNDLHSTVGCNVDTFVYADGSGTTVTLNSVTSQGTTTNALYANNGAEIDFSIATIQNCTNALRLNNASSIHGSTPSIDADTVTKHIWVEDLESDIHLLGGGLDKERIYYPEGFDDDLLFFEDHTAEALTIHSRLDVGRPDLGRSTSMGEGAPYTRDMVVLTTDDTVTSGTDGGNITDVSDDAASTASGTIFTFQGTTAEHTILFGSDRYHVDDDDKVRLRGVRFDQSVAAVEATAKSFILEYWNGTAWIETQMMATDRVKFYQYSNEAFIRNNSEYIFFYYHDDWTKKTINGKNLFWVRFRIKYDLTTAPVFDHCKLMSSRVKIGRDGYGVYFGDARFRQTLLASGNIFGESGGVVTDLIDVGTGSIPTGWTHTIKNSLLKGIGDAIYFQANIPRGVCTSCPFHIVVNGHVKGAGASSDGTIIISVLPIEVQGVLEADPAGGITPVNRTLANTETLTTNPAQVTTASVPFTVEDKFIKIKSNDVDISNYYPGDMLVVRVELDDNGDQNKDFAVWSVEIQGVKFSHGERLS